MLAYFYVYSDVDVDAERKRCIDAFFFQQDSPGLGIQLGYPGTYTQPLSYFFLTSTTKERGTCDLRGLDVFTWLY